MSTDSYDDNGKAIMHIIETCWLLGIESKDLKPICGKGYIASGGRDASDPAYMAIRHAEDHCDILRHMKDDQEDKTLMLKQLLKCYSGPCTKWDESNQRRPDGSVLLFVTFKSHFDGKASVDGSVDPKDINITETFKSVIKVLNWGKCSTGKYSAYVQFQRDCTETEWVPNDCEKPWVIYLFWATWTPLTKENVITLRNIPLLLDSGFVVYGYKTDCKLGGSGNGNFTGIVLSHGNEAQSRKLSVAEREDSDGLVFRPLVDVPQKEKQANACFEGEPEGLLFHQDKNLGPKEASEAEATEEAEEGEARRTEPGLEEQAAIRKQEVRGVDVDVKTQGVAQELGSADVARFVPEQRKRFWNAWCELEMRQTTSDWASLRYLLPIPGDVEHVLGGSEADVFRIGSPGENFRYITLPPTGDDGMQLLMMAKFRIGAVPAGNNSHRLSTSRGLQDAVWILTPGQDAAVSPRRPCPAEQIRGAAVRTLTETIANKRQTHLLVRGHRPKPSRPSRQPAHGPDDRPRVDRGDVRAGFPFGLRRFCIDQCDCDTYPNFWGPKKPLVDPLADAQVPWETPPMGKIIQIGQQWERDELMRKVDLPTFHSQGCSLTLELYAQIYHLIRRFIRGSVAWVDRKYRTSISPSSGQEEEQATDQDTDRTTKKETAKGQEETKDQKRRDGTYLRPDRASPPTMDDEQPSFHVTGFPTKRKAHQKLIPSNMWLYWKGTIRRLPGTPSLLEPTPPPL
eukprot:g63579.t1